MGIGLDCPLECRAKIQRWPFIVVQIMIFPLRCTQGLLGLMELIPTREGKKYEEKLKGKKKQIGSYKKENKFLILQREKVGQLKDK